MQQAASLLAQFTDGRQFADYDRDAMLRAAVGREFEIIGEALGQLAKLLQLSRRSDVRGDRSGWSSL
jgi:uncharacterized protein with HEPN domain